MFSAAYYENRDFEPRPWSRPSAPARNQSGAWSPAASSSCSGWPITGRRSARECRPEQFRRHPVRVFSRPSGGFEAFKSGAFTFREEFTARVWATLYDFPAVTEGRVRREVLPDARPSGTQGWFSTPAARRSAMPGARGHRPVLRLRVVEEEPVLRQLPPHGLVLRNSDLKARDARRRRTRPPRSPACRLAARCSASLDAAGFRRVGPGPGQPQPRRALLREAGCTREGGIVRLPGGKPLEIEFLDADPVFEPVTHPFIRNLGLIGIRPAFASSMPRSTSRA